MVAGAAIAVGLMVLLYRLKHSGENQALFEKKKFFFTSVERLFYDALVAGAGSKHIVFPHVGLTEVLRLDPQASPKILSKLQAHSVDYVICDTLSLTVVGVVALSKAAEKDAKNMQRDMFVSQALAAAGLPLLKIKAQKSYDIEEISRILKENMFDTAVQTSDGQEGVTSHKTVSQQVVVDVALTPMLGEKEIATKRKLCPKCSSEMVLRKADKGRRAGSYFLTCSTFPVCKRAEPVDGDVVKQKHWETGEVVAS